MTEDVRKSHPDGHYYSPIPNASDVERGLEWAGQRASDRTLPGIQTNLKAQWDYLAEAAAAAAMVENLRGRGRSARYDRASTMFGPGDAAIYRLMIGWQRPRRIIELGIGHSTALALDTIDEFALPTSVLAVDPDPVRIGAWRAESKGTLEIVTGLAQDVTPAAVAELTAGDILFIDSTHVAKVGSDVLHEVFSLLPALQPGVLVHFHDIPAWFEYQQDWWEEGRNWNEAYFVRAFLMFNWSFEIVTWAHLLLTVDAERASGLVPELSVNSGASLWLRRV